MIPPSVCDWAWFGSQALAHLADCGTRVDEVTWIKHAYAWLYERLERAARDGLPPPIAQPEGPGPRMVPVLGATAQHACLGFVGVECHEATPPDPHDDTQRAAQQAAQAVVDLFRRLDPDVGNPHLQFAFSSGGGPSVGLSAVIAAVAHLLDGAVAGDVAATGCFERGEIRPVDPDTVAAKAAAACGFGYRRLLVAEGQAGLDEVRGIQIIEVPPKLVPALFVVMRHAVNGSDDQALAQLLAIFDREAAASPDGDLGAALRLTEEFTAGAAPCLVRHIAHDIRSRIYLRQGRTSEAVEEKESAERDRPDAFDFPRGWLEHYLKWHQAAHHARLALDQGRWDDNQLEHALLDRTLQRLDGAIDDGQAGKGELLAAMVLRNNRARRFEFLGRWHEDASLLRRAWDDYTRFQPYWSKLFRYCHDLGLHGNDPERQHNCCIDVLADHHAICGRLPEGWGAAGLNLWPERFAGSVADLDAFDLLSWLRWRAIGGGGLPPSAVAEVLASAARMAAGGPAVYPVFVVFETLLRYGLGSAEQQGEAAERLARCCLFQAALEPTSILTLLALRAERLLEAAARPQPPAVRPLPDTRLAELAAGLLRDPPSIVRRCPY